MKITYSLILLLLLSFHANAQIDNSKSAQLADAESRPSELKPEGTLDVKNIISLKLGITDPLLAVSYERLFSPNVGAEVALGVLGISFGPKFYIPSIRPNKVNFQTGVILGWGYFAEGMYAYLPIGINRLTKNNFMISFDLGPQYKIDGEEFLPGMSFKIGKAF